LAFVPAQWQGVLTQINTERRKDKFEELSRSAELSVSRNSHESGKRGEKTEKKLIGDSISYKRVKTPTSW